MKDIALTFDDILLEPQYTEIKSRQDVDVSTRLTKKHHINIPIVSSNMDTITENDMMLAMTNLGTVGFLHRFMNNGKMVDEIKKYKLAPKEQRFIPPTVVSIGVNENIEEKITLLSSLVQKLVLCIDIAHGDCKRVIDLIKYLKKNHPYDVIAGNVATPQGIRRLCEAGADAIKVGIGPGSLCTTRLTTGCGVPQLTAIMKCSEVAYDFNVPIIADGGIRNSGDIIKALAAGAESVMLGSLLSGCDECPGETVIKNGKLCKKYRGMASREAMDDWKGSYHAAPEGESKVVECKGPVSKIINELVAGVRSGMTYCNALNIKELQNNAKFIGVSSSTVIENKAHGK